MSLDKVKQELALVDLLEKNIQEFCRLSSELKTLRNDFCWNGISQDLVVKVYKKYEGKTILQESGDLYLVETLIDEDVRLCRRIKLNLELSKEKYKLTRNVDLDADGDFNFDWYEVELVGESDE